MVLFDYSVANHSYFYSFDVRTAALVSCVTLSDLLRARWLRELLTHDPRGLQTPNRGGERGQAGGPETVGVQATPTERQCLFL